MSQKSDKAETEAKVASERKLGSVQVEVKEVDLTPPTRAVNRMWPNR